MKHIFESATSACRQAALVTLGVVALTVIGAPLTQAQALRSASFESGGFAVCTNGRVYDQPCVNEDGTPRNGKLYGIDDDGIIFNVARESKAEAEVVNSPSGSGKVAKYTLLTNGGERAEASLDKAGAKGGVNGSTRWYGLSTYIPSDLALSESGPRVNFIQWHRLQECNDGDGVDDTCLGWTKGDPMVMAFLGRLQHYQLYYTYQTNPNDTTTRVNVNEELNHPDAGTWRDDRGKWVHWAMHANWSADSNGFFILYKNGKEIFRRNGAVWLNLPEGPTFKAGMYTGNPIGSDDATMSLYVDNMKIAGPESARCDVDSSCVSGGTPGCTVRYVPNAATNLTATTQSLSQINLSWTDNSSVEDGYKVERCTGAGCTNFTEIASLAPNTASYANTGLSASTTYSYLIRGYNCLGNSVSSVAEATTQPPPPIISESFNSSPAPFTTAGGPWTVNSGKYRLSALPTAPSSGNGSIAVHNRSVNGNFTLTADAGVNASASSAWEDFSIIFNYVDAQNYFYASFCANNDGNTNGLFQVTNGVATPRADFASTITPVTTAWTTNYTIKVVRTGSEIKVYRGAVGSTSQTLLATWTGTQPSGGKVGFGSRNDACTFDNLLVTTASQSSTQQVSVGGDTYNVEWLSADDFSNATWTDRWVKEGPSNVSVSNGRLNVTKPTTGGGEATIWYKEQLPANLIVRYKARALGTDTANRSNFNQFSHMTETNGGPIVYNRAGKYADYHNIPGYIATFTDEHTRIRRVPGFDTNLLSESLTTKSVEDIDYTTVYTVQDGRIRYYLNGTKIHDVALGSHTSHQTALPGGQFAIRTWNTTAWWDDFEFGRIVP